MEGRHQHLSGILKLDDTTEMKTLYRILTSILHALILLPVTVLPSCTQDITDGLTRGMAEVTLVLDAGTVTKAINIDENNEFRTIRIYAYPHRNTGEDGSGDTPVGYFYDNDLSGNGPYYCTMPLELSGESQQIDFHVLVNDGAMTPKEYQNIDLGKDSTRGDIEKYMFSADAKPYAGGFNAIPMSNLPKKQTANGEENRTFTIRRTSSPQYIDIEVTRAMARLRLEFAKVGRSEVKITEATLKRGPKITWLMNEPEKSDQNRTDMNYNPDIKNTFLSDSGGVEITTEADPNTDPENRTYQFVTETYMLENFYGADPANPNDPPTGTDESYGYQLNLTYTIDGEPKTKTVYLPPVTRNQTINVRGTIEASTLTVKIEVLPWNVEESAIGWEPAFEYGGNAPMAAWQMQEDNGKLVPDPDFKDATTGDEEAACCYVLYPRYGRSGGKSDHSTIVNKSSYAAFYFRMTKPEGAVWEAYLTNTEDFCFNTNGTYDSDGDGNPDKRCAITGIAREEPYQIQIGANNAWTQASDATGDGFEGGDSGWYNLTPWGERIEKSGEQYDIHTDLYIRISLDGGTTWSNLKINPNTTEYKDDDDGTTYLNRTYWNEMRRFAGGDYYVRIWQLKAVRGEESFSDLVTQLESQWKIKDFWKGDSN